jgi:uncharacterized protein YaaQ
MTAGVPATNGKHTAEPTQQSQRGARRARVPTPTAGGVRETATRLVLAIVEDEDAHTVVDALTTEGFRVTRLSGAGGFLRRGNATLLMGTEARRVPQVLALLERVCAARTELSLPMAMEFLAGSPLAAPVEVRVGGATVFVLEVGHFERV